MNQTGTVKSGAILILTTRYKLYQVYIRIMIQCNISNVDSTVEGVIVHFPQRFGSNLASLCIYINFD